MTARVGRLLQRVLPASVVVQLRAARGRAHAHRLFRAWGCLALNDKLLERFGPRVQEGPFAGLHLSPRARDEHLGPYLLGVYESELDEAWRVVLGGRYRQVVDIGAKFGYYAVGLALRLEGVPVVAFDADWWARRALREMAAANGARVTVRSLCTPAWLRTQVAEGALIVCDCEGCEAGLFDRPPEGPLRSAVLLIETHDDIVPGLTDRLRERFAPTHVVTCVATSPDRRTSTRELGFLSDAERQQANHEVRGSQRWLLCLPLAGVNAGLAAAW